MSDRAHDVIAFIAWGEYLRLRVEMQEDGTWPFTEGEPREMAVQRPGEVEAPSYLDAELPEYAGLLTVQLYWPAVGPLMASGCSGRDDDGVLIREGMVLVAHDGGPNSRSWLVKREVHAGMWELVPAPDEPLQVHVLLRTTAELNAPHWHRRESQAPREVDCRYGCCRAGEVLLYSEVVRVADVG